MRKKNRKNYKVFNMKGIKYDELNKVIAMMVNYIKSFNVS